MEDLGAVQQKILCIFETDVVDEPSSKRSYQQFQVVATNKLKQTAKDDNIQTAKPTEKLDGTCCYIAEFKGRPWLWARLDRKPNKAAEKRFRKFQTHKRGAEAETKTAETDFQWDVAKDFKDVPADWIPASGVPLDSSGHPLPDSNGHIPGWVPVDPQSRQHCWHLTAVNLQQGLGLVLRASTTDPGDLCIEVADLSKLTGKTAELIGTNVNGNPYGLGSKQIPLHCLVIHGTLPAPDVPEDLTIDSMKTWFQTPGTGNVEGVVWHCRNGSLYKVHRHHLNLPWPVKEPSLSCRRVHVDVNMSRYEMEEDKKSCLWTMSRLHGQSFSSLRTLAETLQSRISAR